MGKYKHLWKRSLDGDYREQRSFVRVVIVVAVLFLAFFTVKKDNIFRWISARLTIASQNTEIRALEAENAELERRYKALSTNRDSLETYARENFDFTEPGETLYLLQ